MESSIQELLDEEKGKLRSFIHESESIEFKSDEWEVDVIRLAVKYENYLEKYGNRIGESRLHELSSTFNTAMKYRKMNHFLAFAISAAICFPLSVVAGFMFAHLLGRGSDSTWLITYPVILIISTIAVSYPMETEVESWMKHISTRAVSKLDKLIE